MYLISHVFLPLLAQSWLVPMPGVCISVLIQQVEFQPAYIASRPFCTFQCNTFGCGFLVILMYLWPDIFSNAVVFLFKPS